ncbi:MAG: HNH endonuclease [Alkalinema sp. RU_4_3]|nr:HNH endonuclease [Alkalinema sp. RU_4_3]
MSSSYISEALRQIIIARAQNRCEYCKCSADVTTEMFSVEHTYPRSLGGGNTLDNLAWSCLGCNSFKGARIKAIDPLTQQLAPIFNPRQHNWEEHFSWSADYCEIIGQTPTGRASVQALKLNRKGVMNLRRLLAQVGEHPP